MEAIRPLQRGAAAAPEDQRRIEDLVKAVERQNPNKSSLAAPELNGAGRPSCCCSRGHVSASLCARAAPGCALPAGRPQRDQDTGCDAGKWELLYTTSRSILATGRPPFLRPFGPIFQYIGAHCPSWSLLTPAQQRVERWTASAHAWTAHHMCDGPANQVLIVTDVRCRCRKPESSQQGKLALLESGVAPLQPSSIPQVFHSP